MSEYTKRLIVVMIAVVVVLVATTVGFVYCESLRDRLVGDCIRSGRPMLECKALTQDADCAGR
jgi:hypothetical protein